MRFFFKLPLRFISRRQLASTVGGDSILLDGWHVTPMGESDVGTRTRLSLLSKEMLESKQIGIRGLSRMGFRMIDGSFLYGPIAVFPKAVLSWRVLTPSDITSESVEFFTMLEPKLDILVVGVGDRKHVDSVRARIAPILSKNRIGLEIMETEEAIPTFNFLNAEHRYVAAALYPPDEMVVTDAEYSEALKLLKRWDELDEHPLLLGIDSTLSETKDAIKRLWDGRKSKAIERLLDPGENLLDDGEKRVLLADKKKSKS